MASLPASNSHQRFIADVFRWSRPRQIRSMLQWSCDEMIIPDGPFSGMRFRPDRQPYTRPLLLEMGRWRRHNATGPTQSGKSFTCYITPILYHLFERGESVICGLPTLDMAANKWQKDLRPAIESTRYRDLIPRRGPGSQGGTPTEVIFENGASLLFMTGGGGDKQRAGATAPCVVITETDGMDEIGGTSREADKITQLEVRTNAFQAVGRDRIYMECTVSTEDGRTWREHNAGTCSRLAVPCRHCGAWVTPEREDLIGWQDAETKLDAGQQAAFTCPECGGLFSEADRRQMNNDGKIVHRGQEITEAGEIVGPVPQTDTFSFRWNAFNNMFTTAQRLAELEWAASRSEDPDTAELKMRQFFWTQPAKNDNVEKVAISIGIVRGSDSKYAGRCSGIPRGVVPDGAEYLTCFIDLGKEFLSWQVKAWFTGFSHVVDYGFHQTSMPHVVGDDVAISGALRELRESLREKYSFHAALVDAGKWNHLVYPFIRESGGQWFPSKGFGKSENTGYRHPLPPKPGEISPDKVPSPNGDQWYQSWQKDEGINVINFDADWWKHKVHAAYLIRPFNEGQRQRGSVTLFGENPNDHNELGKQLTAEVFTREFKKGRLGMVEFWNKVSRNNHLFDCEVGNIVARSLAEAIRASQQVTSTPMVANAGDNRLDRFYR